MGACSSRSIVSPAIVPYKPVRKHRHNNSCRAKAFAIASSMNSRGCALLEKGEYDAAMTVFQRALLKSRLLSILEESDLSYHLDRDGKLVERNIEKQPISSRLSLTSFTAKDENVSKELYVYQREMYDEGFGTFSDPLPMNTDETQSASVLLYNMGLVCLRQKKYSKAIEHFHLALFEEEQEHRPDGTKNQKCCRAHHTVAILHNIGRVQYLLGRYKDSLRTFEEVLQFQTDLPQSNPLHVASTKTCIFMLKWAMLDLEYDMPDSEREAVSERLRRELLEDALRVKKESLGTDHLEVATILNHVGCSYSQEKEKEKRLEAFEECLRIRQSILPADHPDILQAMDNVAHAYNELDKTDKALSLFQQCLQSMKKSLGNVHRDVSAVLLSIATIHARKGDLDTALETCEEALQVGKDALGDSHSQVGIILHMKGAMLQAKGDNERAVKALRDSHEICSEVWGPNNFRIGSILDSIGRIQVEMENYDDALDSFRSALRIWKDYVDADPLEVARALHICGQIHEINGEALSSVTAYVAALNTLRLPDGKYAKHIDCARVLHSLGICVAKLGSEDSALELLTEALEIRKTFYDKPHKDVAASLGAIAGVHINRGDEEAALSFLEQTLREEEAVYGPSHLEVATTLFMIGKIHLSNGDTQKTLEYFRRVLVIEKESLGDGSTAVAETLNAIGNVHLQRRELKEAVDALSEAARMYTKAGEDWWGKVTISRLDLYDFKTDYPDCPPAA